MFTPMNPEGLIKLIGTGTAGATVTAAGTAIAAATQLSKGLSMVTAPTDTDAVGVQLPGLPGATLTPGDVGAVLVVHCNAGTNTVKIYPDTGGNINGASASAAVTVADGAIAVCFLHSVTASGTNWVGTWLAGEIAAA